MPAPRHEQRGASPTPPRRPEAAAYLPRTAARGPPGAVLPRHHPPLRLPARPLHPHHPTECYSLPARPSQELPAPVRPPASPRARRPSSGASRTPPALSALGTGPPAPLSPCLEAVLRPASGSPISRGIARDAPSCEPHDAPAPARSWPPAYYEPGACRALYYYFKILLIL